MTAVTSPLGLVALAALLLAGAPGAPARPGTARSEGAGVPRHRSYAWEMRIPAIGLGAPVVDLPGDKYVAFAVPPQVKPWEVSWFPYGALPGRPGNAVAFGHVDTLTGPGVFYNLYRLRPGDTIYLDLSRGRTVRYTVREVSEVPRSRFPFRLILGHGRRPILWLITCAGQFDRATQSYTAIMIVSSTLVVRSDSRSAAPPSGSRRDRRRR